MPKSSEVDLHDGVASKCPHCVEILKPLEMLMHLKLKHFSVQFNIEVYENMPHFFPIDALKLKPCNNHVIGTFAYSGALKRDTATNQPPIPMLLMLYVGPRPLHVDDQQVYLFFLVTPQQSNPDISAVVSLFDVNLKEERKGIRCLRNMFSSPLGWNSYERIHSGTDYLMYTKKDFKDLCGTGEQYKIFAKISVFGDPCKAY